MTDLRVLALVVCLCGGCGDCYESTSREEDAGIDFDARRPDAGLEDICPESAEPRLDPGSLPTCGMIMTSDNYPIETVSAGCERYLGGIGFPFASDEDLRVLESLRWIDGGLAMNATGELTTLAGVERLEHVGGTLLIWNERIDSLAPLGRLRRIEGRLDIRDNSALTSLHGLGRLEEVGALNLKFLPELRDRVSIDALRCLRRVEGDVYLVEVPRDQVDAFLARVEVGGSVTLDGEVIVEGPGTGL